MKYSSKNKINLNRLVNLKIGYLVKQNVRNQSSYKFHKKELNALNCGFNFSLTKLKLINNLIFMR